MARRAKTIEDGRTKEGAILLIDGGDALYAKNVGLTLQDSGRARLIAEAMAEMKYDAIAVGERDLARGLDELKKTGDELHLPLLAANLLDAQGQHPFPGTRLISTAQGKVGVFAITNLPNNVLGGLRCDDPREAARLAIADLRNQGAVLVVGLFHMPTASAIELSKGLEGVDSIVVAHDGQGRVLSTQPPTYGLGQRGREVIELTIDLGKGPIADPSARGDAKDQAAVLDNTVRTLEQRMSAAKTPDAQKSVEAQLTVLRKRRDQALADAQRPVEGRVATEKTIALGTNISDDPKWAKRVEEEVARDGRTPGH